MFQGELLEVDPPLIKLKPILAAAADHARLLRVRLGEVVTDQLAVHWAEEFAAALRANAAKQERLRCTFAQYVGSKIDDHFVHVLSMQIAARESELGSNMLVVYDRPARPEWVALSVTSVKPAVWRDDKPGVEFTMEALSGHPAGHTLHRKFPRNWLNFLAYKVGFSRRIQYDDEPRLFVGFRFLGYLRPRPDSTEVDFDAWFITTALKKHNVEIIKLRTRLEYDKAECPFHFEHQCYNCPKRLNECPASYLRNS